MFEQFTKRLMQIFAGVIALVIVVGLFQAAGPLIGNVESTLNVLPLTGEGNPFGNITKVVLSFFVPAMVLGVAAVALTMWWK